jgi:hypothetical protein
MTTTDGTTDGSTARSTIGPTTGSTGRPTGRSTLSISCGDCELQGTSACDDCIVTFVLGRDPTDAVVVDADEVRAIRMLGRAGLVPELRHPGAAGRWAAC